MKNRYFLRKASNALILACLLTGMAAMPNGSLFAQPATAVKNIVIVHGAFADGSGWQDVYTILKAHGYNVTMVQNPLTSYWSIPWRSRALNVPSKSSSSRPQI